MLISAQNLTVKPFSSLFHSILKSLYSEEPFYVCTLHVCCYEVLWVLIIVSSSFPDSMYVKQNSDTAEGWEFMECKSRKVQIFLKLQLQITKNAFTTIIKPFWRMHGSFLEYHKQSHSSFFRSSENLFTHTRKTGNNAQNDILLFDFLYNATLLCSLK